MRRCTPTCIYKNALSNYLQEMSCCKCIEGKLSAITWHLTQFKMSCQREFQYLVKVYTNQEKTNFGVLYSENIPTVRLKNKLLETK